MLGRMFNSAGRKVGRFFGVVPQKIAPQPGQVIWPNDQTITDLNNCWKITADIDVGTGSALFVSGTKIHAWEQGVRMQFNEESKLWEIFISKKHCAAEAGELNQFKFLVGAFEAGVDGVAPANQLRFEDGHDRDLQAGDFHIEKRDFPNYFNECRK